MQTPKQKQIALTGSLTIPRLPLGLVSSAKTETIRQAVALDVKVEFTDLKKRLFSYELDFKFSGEKNNVMKLFDYVDSFQVIYR